MKGFQNALSEYQTLESSKQVYNVMTNVSSITGMEQGKTSFNPSTGYINVAFGADATNPLGTLAHEFAHAYQYENGDVDMKYDGSGSDGLSDLQDELSDFQQGQLVDPSYYHDIKLTTQILESSYPNNSNVPKNSASAFGPSTYRGEMNKELFQKAGLGIAPNVIMIGWQVPYALGLLIPKGY